MLPRGDALRFASRLPLAFIFRPFGARHQLPNRHDLLGHSQYHVQWRASRLDTVSTARGSGWVGRLVKRESESDSYIAVRATEQSLGYVIDLNNPHINSSVTTVDQPVLGRTLLAS